MTLPVAFGRSITLPRVLRVRDSSAGGGTSPTGVDEASGASSGGRTAVRIQLRDFLGRCVKWELPIPRSRTNNAAVALLAHGGAPFLRCRPTQLKTLCLQRGR